MNRNNRKRVIIKTERVAMNRILTIASLRAASLPSRRSPNRVRRAIRQTEVSHQNPLTAASQVKVATVKKVANLVAVASRVRAAKVRAAKAVLTRAADRNKLAANHKDPKEAHLREVLLIPKAVVTQVVAARAAATSSHKTNRQKMVRDQTSKAVVRINQARAARPVIKRAVRAETASNRMAISASRWEKTRPTATGFRACKRG